MLDLTLDLPQMHYTALPEVKAYLLEIIEQTYQSDRASRRS